MKRFLLIFILTIFVMGGFSQTESYTSEQQEAYNYAYSQKITTISSIEKANLEGQLTRIAMAKMISNFAINVLGLQPDTSKNCSFSDVPKSLDSDYNYGATQACQLELMGIGDNGKKSDKFYPYETVTRAQFATAFSRALSKANGKIVENGNPYYSTHLQYLHSKGIINNVTSPSPTNVERRGNVMIMMWRASKNVSKNTEEQNDSKGSSEYYYKDLNITADIGLDGAINVLENFTAYFNVNKHGIIRVIPLLYTIGGENYDITISNVNVKGHNFNTYTEGLEFNIKIGDSDKLIKGTQIYPISYKVNGLIRELSGYSELYRNLVGYDFDTKINNVRAEITLPKSYTGFSKDDFTITTTDGLTKSTGGFQGTVNLSAGNKIIVTYSEGLPAYEGITLSIRFPSDYFKFDSN